MDASIILAASPEAPFFISMLGNSCMWFSSFPDQLSVSLRERSSGSPRRDINDGCRCRAPPSPREGVVWATPWEQGVLRQGGESCSSGLSSTLLSPFCFLSPLPYLYNLEWSDLGMPVGSLSLMEPHKNSWALAALRLECLETEWFSGGLICSHCSCFHYFWPGAGYIFHIGITKYPARRDLREERLIMAMVWGDMV